jgi:3'-phosphoadenosine 5'-phosphosulfate sulfotransferase (PAPS reductase)/FAD synthetase
VDEKSLRAAGPQIGALEAPPFALLHVDTRAELDRTIAWVRRTTIGGW